MAALTGDIYQMLRNNESRTQAQKQTSTALSSISSEPSTISKTSLNTTQEDNEEKKGETVYSPTENSKNVNAGVGTTTTLEPSTASVANENTINELYERTLNTQKMWLGDNYEWSAEEAQTFKSMLSLSDNPEETASRYIASKGYATMFGLDTKSVYDNLDTISEYYTGDVYSTKNVSLWQKVKNGFLRNDIMSLKYEYMIADIKGDTERATTLKKQIDTKEAELGDSSNAIPASWLDKISTSVLENFGYIVEPTLKGSIPSMLVSAAGTAVAAAFPVSAGPVMAATSTLATATATIFSGKQMYEWAAGERYYSLMNDPEYQGVQSKGQAQLLATIEGLGVATIESFLDGATSRIVGAVSGKEISKIGINSLVDLERRGVTSTVAQATYEWVTGALDEGFLNEAPEYILGEATSIIYKNSNGIVDDKTWSERYDEMKESIIDGIIVGAVYGAVSIPSSIKSDRATAINLRRAANQSRTESEFREATKDMKPETMSDEDFDTARTQVYKASQEQKSEFLYDNFKDTVLESEEIAGQELYNTVDENGEETAKVIPDGTVYRDTEGELYSESKTDDNTGTTKVYYGDRTSGAVYGYVEVATDGDTQTVRSVRVRHGYESIRSEMVRDAVANTATTETNVEWNPTTHGLQSVKDELVSNNPDKKGLVYRTTLTGRDADIQSVKTQIKTANPSISDAEATVAARLTTIADVGTGTIKYESSANIPEGQRTRETTDFRGATDTAKALIYTGEQSDISTYVHELFHAVASVRTKEAQNLSNSIRKTFADEAETANLRKFVTDHVKIWGKDGDVEKIMSSLKAIGENATAKEWTVGQNENLARLYEAYRSSSKSVQQSLPQAIRAILEKLTQFMNKVYRTMKDNTALNEDIAKAYDSLMGMDEAAQRVESKGAEAEFRAYGDVAIDEDGNDVGDAGLIYQEVTDKGLLEELEEGETIKVYRSMQLIDGKLYPPMAEVVEGKRQATTEVGKWYQSDERPDLAYEKKKEKGSGKWYFKLLKYYVNGESSTVDARYNPYFHTTSSPLNDQFSAAYRRPNLVVVEVEMPKSELTSGYRAEKAKDTVGEMNWHSGIVSGALAKKTGKHRSVILTRYNKVIRILDNAEVASNIAEQLKDTGIKIPENVVSPGLYEELKKLGVEFVDVKAVQKYRDAQNGILYQDTTLDDLDNINNLDDAERIANEGVTDAEAANEADYFRTHNVESEIFDLDLPEDYEYNFTSDDANRLESERQLESALPTIDSIELPPDVAGVFWEEYDESELAGRDPEDGLIQGSNNLGWTYPQFVGINEPKGIEYTGTDAQKDTVFREAIKDDTVLKQYLSLIAEASLYGTRYTNRGYEDGTDSFGRFTQIAVDYPFKDDAYRQTLRDRLYPQLSGRSLTGIMQTVLSNSDDLTEAQIKKARKELSDNARAYRNMLALLTKNDEMLPVELVSEVEGLDIPSRETQNSMSISDIAALARKAGNKTLENSILNGTAKFGKGTDVTALKDLKALITDLNKQIRDKEAEVEKLDTESKTYETELNNANEAIEGYRKAILDAEEVLSVLADTFDGENEDGTASSSAKYRGELAQKYAALQEKYSILSPYREQEHQADATEAQLDRKVKDGSHMREKKTKGHAGWRQQYRGQKYGTEAWVKEVTSTYPDIKERIEAEAEKDKRKSYEAVAKDVIETVRGELKDELDSLRVQMTASAARTVQANFSKLYKSLSAIKAISEGTGIVVANVDLDEMKATQKELADELKRAEKKIENRDEKVRKTELLGKWRLAKERQEQKLKLAETIKEGKEATKEALREQREQHAEEIRQLREEQRQKEKQKRIYQAIRDEKQRIANRIMRNVNLKTVDYSKAREIVAIQALIDPEFRRDWIYDLQTDAAQESGYQTMTIEEAKDYLNSLDDAQRIDLFSYMPQDLIERLTEQRRPLNDWTIAELQTLSNAVEELRLEGEAILKAKKDARNAQAMSIQRDILRTLGALEEHDTIPSSIDRSKEKKSIRERWHGIVYRTRRMQELAQLLDGGFGHKGTGYRLLVEEKRWHQNREQQKIEGRYKAVEGYATKEAIDGMVDSVEVQLAGINKPVTFTVDQLAYAWLSQYDELNKAAVMYGCLLTESEKGTKYPAGYDVDYLTGKKVITNNWLVNRGELISDDLELEAIAKDRYDTLLNKAKEELTDRGLWDLVNAIKDDFNNRDNSDRLDAASIEYFNVPLAKRESYLPIRRQALTGQNLEDAKADEVFNKYTGQFQSDPYKGFLQERIVISPRHQMPVDMSLLGVWQQSVKDQEHFIEFCGYVKKLRSIFTSNRSNEVQRAITAKRTTALFDEIDRYINLVANPDAEQGKQDTINNVIRTVRGKTGAAYLGWKASGIILQAITSPASAFSELKPWEVIGSYLQIARHPIESIKAINEKSTFMKNRTMNPIIDEAIQRRNEWTKSNLSKKVDKFEEVGQIGLTLVDRYAVAGPWLAKYQRTLRENLKNGMDTATAEQFAITKADEFIYQTQPVGDSTEIASMFRSKSEVAKTLLQFQTSLNVVWNNLTANTIGYARNNKMASAVGMIVGYSVAGILLGLVQNGFDDDDDSGDKAKKLAYWSMSQLLGSTPIFGSTADSFVKDLITGDYDWYMLNGVSISPIVDKTIQGVTALKSDKPIKAIGKFAEAGGLATGLPTSGFKEVVEVFQKHSLAPLVGRE